MSIETITALRLRLASPEQIRQWSDGEVISAETIHYRKQQPVLGGLFCERIFGPTRDWSCACGKYEYQHESGVVCERCGVELAPATVRRERLGHIELVAPVVHPWFLRDRTLSTLLDLSSWQLSAILTAQRYLVLWVHEEERANMLLQQHTQDNAEAALYDQFARMLPGDLLETDTYWDMYRLFPALFQAKTGVAAVQDLLSQLDLDALATQLQREIEAGNASHAVSRRLQVVEAFRASGQSPSLLVLSVIPVLPPELRPLLVLDGGRIVSSDLNDLYIRLLHRNRRLQRFVERGAPDIMLHHEHRLLQDACDALFDNAHRKHPLTNARGQTLKSLTDALQGKQGRFRRNLLGKRVDYSGRSVIVVGPELSLHECGLPKDMACELFKPFLMRKLLDRQFARSPRMAKRLVERRDPVIWDLLAEVLFERVVLLNRAPTLHRLSIQAFVPRLVEGQAIQLHPMVCSAFNADFDGDQMAVHVPLSQAAQDEARRLVLSTHNLRHPASGEPVIAPSQDIVLGCFYLTADRPSTRQGTYLFATQEEAVLALSAGHIDLHTPLVVRIGEQPVYETPSTVPERAPRGRVTTTVGRLLFNKILPEPLRYRNYPMSKAQLKSLVAECLARCGEATTVSLLDAMKRLGYQYATKSGMSLATSDITIPTTRAKLIARGQQREEEIDASARRGEMTTEEWSRQVIELWSQVTDEISQEAQAALDPNGPIMTIVQSGATKASFQQIRQLSGIRGLMANPSGKIIPFPVLSNYKLGLRPWELFIAASGARKGFMDRSLNTAMSGYLTRRLVEAGMEVIVTQHDCQASEGLLITQEEMLENDRSMLRAQVTGRVLAESAGPFQAGTLLDAQHADALLKDGVTSLRIRSPLSCQAPYGVCQCCYGADLATGSLVELGTAVGVIAGQAIGEPGTQLTMRTFHSGGIAQNTADITLGLPRVIDLFEVRSPAQAAPFAEREGIVAHIETDSTTGAHRIRCVYRACEAQKARTYTVPAGQVLTVREGQAITRGMPFSEGPCDPHAILLQLGMETAQRYLIQEVQRVYQGVGAIIHDKHLEVIVRQMSRYVQVSASGETDLLPGDIVDRFVFQERVTHSLAQGGNPARARPLLLGLTKTVLQTASWIAAASFQDTARVLARAAIRGQQDALIGLKERLVIGKRIPTRGSYEETR